MNEKKQLQVIDEREILGKQFRIFGSIEEPIFVAQDVAEWLENKDVTSMLRTVDDNEKLLRSISGAGQSREMMCLTEDGLYEVLMQSRKPIAKQFKSKTKEVLRSIRKHGAYMTPAMLEEVLLNPDTIIRLATDLKNEREIRMAAEASLAIAQPKVEFYDAIASDPGAYWSLREAPKAFPMPGLTESWLRNSCKEEGWMAKSSTKDSVTEKGRRGGYMRVITTYYKGIKTDTPVLLGRGFDYMIKRFKHLNGGMF